jgi:hypothetical protein
MQDVAKRNAVLQRELEARSRELVESQRGLAAALEQARKLAVANKRLQNICRALRYGGGRGAAAAAAAVAGDQSAPDGVATAEATSDAVVVPTEALSADSREHSSAAGSVGSLQNATPASVQAESAAPSACSSASGCERHARKPRAACDGDGATARCASPDSPQQAQYVLVSKPADAAEGALPRMVDV